MAGDPAGERLGLSPPFVGQRDVAATRVAPGHRPLGLAVADEPDLAFRARLAHSEASGRMLSSGRGREEFACPPPEEPGEREGRDRRDPRVVAIDLVVVELPAVGDHRLEPLDLVLQVEDVLLGLDRGIRLDDGEQGANRGRGRLGVDGLGRDRFGGGVGGAGAGHLGEHFLFERHRAADRGDERRQLVVALLERDVDVRPGLVDPLP